MLKCRFTRTHYPDAEPTSLCFHSLNGEAANTNAIVSGLTRSQLETTIYRTQDEHANHYTTDAVFNCMLISTLLI
jgi:hypothetical protein